ncbi:hypothetical protein PTE30175_01773 [Pandoraea terrae]|uniref:DUF1329 domain-containing protein n=1 Tax=Pandoraea terrae TaxID=1537710 RepID=A0A5E4U8K4_9BURK|nr:DUF1329 domain-containing protein [Pandoraea terrae]VVD95348.1 hypothetical protein PTE30175_01773 [Pandoraea terrae]
MNTLQLRSLFAISAIGAGLQLPAMAAVSEADAAKLATADVTWFGADARANADGSIPAWTGGTTKSPAAKDASALDNDKPLYSITAANMAQYADKLTEGQKALLKRFPDYRIDVYPTRRTFAASKWIENNTLKNARHCTTIDDGNGLDPKTCLPGVPFPLPKNGKEVIWDYLARTRLYSFATRSKNWLVEASSKPIMSGEVEDTVYAPYYDPKRGDSDATLLSKFQAYTMAPSRSAGEAYLQYQYTDPQAKPTKAWQYIPGQRRVRLAPELTFDTPAPNVGGVATMDQLEVFQGSPERYDMKLIGKQEKLVLNNNHKLMLDKSACGSEKVVQPNFLNPSCMRWELQRVYVVEATVKQGKRHLLPKRVFYVGEDGYQNISSDDYDAAGKLYRTTFRPTVMLPDGPDGPAPFSVTTLLYDFVRGAYLAVALPESGVRAVPAQTSREMSPDSLAATGVR